MLNFDRLLTIKPGDILYECEYGDNLKTEVITKPILKGDQLRAKRFIIS